MVWYMCRSTTVIRAKKACEKKSHVSSGSATCTWGRKRDHPNRHCPSSCQSDTFPLHEINEVHHWLAWSLQSHRRQRRWTELVASFGMRVRR